MKRLLGQKHRSTEAVRRADVSIFSRPAPDTRPPPRPAPVPAPTLHAPGERGPTSGHWCPRVLEAEVGRVTTEEGCHYKHVSTLSPSQLPFTSPQDMMYGRPCLLLELPWMRFGNTTMPAIFSTYLTFLCTSFSFAKFRWHLFKSDNNACMK